LKALKKEEFMGDLMEIRLGVSRLLKEQSRSPEDRFRKESEDNGVKNQAISVLIQT